jgi:hypothetical protein
MEIFKIVVYFPDSPCTGGLQEELIGPEGSRHVESLIKLCYEDGSVVGCIAVPVGKLFLVS